MPPVRYQVEGAGSSKVASRCPLVVEVKSTTFSEWWIRQHTMTTFFAVVPPVTKTLWRLGAPMGPMQRASAASPLKMMIGMRPPFWISCAIRMTA